MNRKVLIVDDEEPIRSLLSVAFQKAGFVPAAAANGDEALGLMKASPTWVAFVDLNMPGMDGLELCRRIRKEWPLAIVYAVTGYASVYDLYECREAGFEDYFTKPVDLSVLVSAANHAFSKVERWQRREAE